MTKNTAEKRKWNFPSMRTIILAVALIMLFFAAGARFGKYMGGEQMLPAIDESAAVYSVDVKGAVMQSGIYTVPAGSRVEDLLEAVELAPDAAPELLNRAAPITDGSELIVPVSEGNIDWNAVASDKGGAYYGKQESSSSESSAAFSGVININTAGVDQLDLLPGIGPTKAQAIIDHRNDHGNFITKEQIMNVSGIGQATYDKIKDNITV